jgi:hypothetical protein
LRDVTLLGNQVKPNTSGRWSRRYRRVCSNLSPRESVGTNSQVAQRSYNPRHPARPAHNSRGNRWDFLQAARPKFTDTSAAVSRRGKQGLVVADGVGHPHRAPGRVFVQSRTTRGCVRCTRRRSRRALCFPEVVAANLRTHTPTPTHLWSPGLPDLDAGSLGVPITTAAFLSPAGGEDRAPPCSDVRLAPPSTKELLYIGRVNRTETWPRWLRHLFRFWLDPGPRAQRSAHKVRSEVQIASLARDRPRGVCSGGP